MPFVVHIGSHKTGTTAIQHFAAAHRRQLRRRGLWYPSYEAIDGPDYHAHHHFAEALCAAPRRQFTDIQAKQFIDHLQAARRPGETVLLSAEPIYRLTLPADGGYWQEREAYLRRLRDVIGNGPVKIIAVLRRQDSFARSLYQEKVKRGYTGTFRTFIDQERTKFNYCRQMTVFEAVFGDVDVLFFEDLVSRGLVRSFFAHLGVDVADLPPPSVANPSLPIELVEFKRLLNGMGIKRKKLRKLGMVLARKAPTLRTTQERVDWLPASDMRAFYASFAAENDELRRRFAADLQRPIFPPLPEPGSADEPAVYAGMTADRFRELVDAFGLADRVDMTRLQEDQLSRGTA